MSATPEEPALVLARAKVAAARGRLIGTAHQIQRRLRPDELARDALEGVRTKSAELAADALDVARARPGVSAGAAAGVAALVLRKPLVRLARRLLRRRNENDG